MKIISQVYFLSCLLVMHNGTLSAQNYTSNGSASSISGGECYEINPATGSQIGTVWYNDQIDLSCDFDWVGTVFFGNAALDSDPDGDGIGFVFHNDASGLAAIGSGVVGSGSISPALCVEFDTYENNCGGLAPPGGDGDPNPCCNVIGQDHIAVFVNGDPFDFLVSPFCVATIDDNTDHPFEVHWNSYNLTLTVHLDGATIINLSSDLVNTVFGGNSMVYFGFTGRTGLYYNEQKFCQNTLAFNGNCCVDTPGFVD